jgi:hypothetical protein
MAGDELPLHIFVGGPIQASKYKLAAFDSLGERE